MAYLKLTCLKCGRHLDVEDAAQDDTMHCRACGTAHEVHVFPAYFDDHESAHAGRRLVIDSEASCYHHPSKQAEVVCDVCGRFLCALCATEFRGQQLCLGCLTGLQNASSQSRLDNRRVLYDDIALALAALPILIWPFTLVTAPIALFLVLRYWRRGPTSIIPRTRIRYVIALLLAGLELTGWSCLILTGW